MPFDHSSFRWFEVSSCKPTPRGPPSSSAQPRGARCNINLGYDRGELLLLIILYTFAPTSELLNLFQEKGVFLRIFAP